MKWTLYRSIRTYIQNSIFHNCTFIVNYNKRLVDPFYGNRGVFIEICKIAFSENKFKYNYIFYPKYGNFFFFVPVIIFNKTFILNS